MSNLPLIVHENLNFVLECISHATCFNTWSIHFNICYFFCRGFPL